MAFFGIVLTLHNKSGTVVFIAVLFFLLVFERGNLCTLLW